jgi:protein tyrosine/serine phosphatase
MHKQTRRPLLSVLSLAVVFAFAAASATAQHSRETIEGVRNFGRVTPNYMRGGQVTPEGVERLAAMGVRTIVDLRDEPSPGEREACERLGITYYKFPMDGHATPDTATVDKILGLIKDAKDPVYVHCSAGKHRAGTIAALYRMRFEGWTPEEAWAEQQSYGFGFPEEHPQLYAFAYGDQKPHLRQSVTRVSAKTSSKDDEKKKERSKKDDDDEDDDEDKAKDRAKDKAKDEDEESGDEVASAAEPSKAEPAKESARVESEAAPEPAAERSAAPSAVAALSAGASYIALDEAITRARSEGGSGDILKIDLEYDPAAKLTTWDVTFSSGTEYEVNAVTGSLVATKQKAAGKLAVLTPLTVDKGFKSFQQIIASLGSGRSVMEMELKHIKGRDAVMYEVLLDDGTLLYFDARTGEPVQGS